MSSSSSPPSIVVAVPPKSVGIALLLTLLFGPLGLLYASVVGTLVVLIGMPLLAVLLGVLLASGGHLMGALGLLGVLPMMWVASLVWAVLAVNAHNRRLMAGNF